MMEAGAIAVGSTAPYQPRHALKEEVRLAREVRAFMDELKLSRLRGSFGYPPPSAVELTRHQFNEVGRLADAVLKAAGQL